MRQEIANLIKDLYDLQDEHFTVFIGISGHIKQVDVDTHNTGWVRHATPTMKFKFYIDDENESTLHDCLAAAKADKAKGREWLANAELRKQEEIKQLKAKLAELEKSSC